MSILLFIAGLILGMGCGFLVRSLLQMASNRTWSGVSCPGVLPTAWRQGRLIRPSETSRPFPAVP